MLYKKSGEKTLSADLFKNPTSEYRATPFWAWNCELDKDELLRQIDIFKEMGLGGFHMHVRTGMATEYLSDEFFTFIKACVSHAKENGMLAYLYDEDRWPSGAAGGIVTKNDAYRQRHLRFTTVPYSGKPDTTVRFEGSSRARTEEGNFVAAFDIEFDEKGYLVSYKRIGENDEAKGKKWYAYLDFAPKSTWFNGQSYIDTMNKEAMDEFIRVTYCAYLKHCGEEFDKTIPSIFTDEPQVSRKTRLTYASDEIDVTTSWTPDFDKTYKEKYGDDIIEHLPELFWNLAENKPSVTRYQYHDHLADRFCESFAVNCGNWCREHGISFTGHLMLEGSLEGQTIAIGEAMRHYKGFGIPGIDMLCGAREFTTAKQTQSAVHQLGSEGMLSELYGVTGWDFDFRGHKLHGDWQAALGVTLRVPHLSWVSMKGEAKRDYPASISYQSPWYSEYRRVEDHFARLNTVLTRGKAIANVGVIHPIESYWLNWGCIEQNSAEAKEKDENFEALLDWLVKGTIDFDLISEATLPEMCPIDAYPFKVGEMAYDVIIVPQCQTLRSSTLERLEAFKAKGGKIIFMGNPPTLENAVPSSRGKQLYDKCTVCGYTKNDILSTLEEDRNVIIRFSNGDTTDRYCHQMRKDGDKKWLFIAQAVDPYNKHVSTCHNVNISVKGEYGVRIFDTSNGDVRVLGAKYENGNTVIPAALYEYDSLLLELTPGRCENYEAPAEAASEAPITVPSSVSYTLSEPNCLLLDMAEYSLDGGEFRPEEEILRLDAKLCAELGLPKRGVYVTQPWVTGKVPDEHTVTLRFRINSEINVSGARFASERMASASITVNGEKVDIAPDGYYVDKSIETVKIPDLHIGENVIDITLPLGVACNTEWCYLIGDFGVTVAGRLKTVTALPEKLAFGDLTHQSLPFYGGNVTYHIPVKTESGKLKVTVPHYIGGLVTVNGESAIYPPYTALTETDKGEAVLDLTLYGNRQNSFGHVHCADTSLEWVGPEAWRTVDSSWSYEYVLRSLGILSTPIVKEIK